MLLTGKLKNPETLAFEQHQNGAAEVRSFCMVRNGSRARFVLKLRGVAGGCACLHRYRKANRHYFFIKNLLIGTKYSQQHEIKKQKCYFWDGFQPLRAASP